MHIISTAWIPGNVAEFEAACCLSAHADLGLASAGVPFDIYILQGYEKLTEDFIRTFADRHIMLHDLGDLTNAYLESHAGLLEILGSHQGSHYEFFCFVRWLVLQDHFAGESFLHIDLDIFFQKPLADIAVEFQGLSGTFGSPCLTSIGSSGWLETYRDALHAIMTRRADFQVEIGYGGNEFRSNISSDQDLISALQHSGRLPQQGLASLLATYYVFVNPLWPFYHHKPSAPVSYVAMDGQDMIGGKPVMFWHLQNSFADYISRFAVISDYGQGWMKDYLPVRLNLPMMQLAPSAENVAFQALRDLSWHRIRETTSRAGDIHQLGLEKYFSRAWVADWFVLKKNGRDLFSSKYWWQDGVFT